MVRLSKRLLLTTGAIIAISAVLWLSVSSDQEKIRKLFETAAKLATFQEEEHPFAKLATAEKLSGIFARDVTLELRLPEETIQVVKDRKHLKEKILAGRTGLAELAVLFSDFEIDIQGEKAHVTVTGRAMGRDPGRTDYFLETRKLECSVVKEEGKWKIQRAVNVEPYIDEVP